jgi:plastocyanin
MKSSVPGTLLTPSAYTVAATPGTVGVATILPRSAMRLLLVTALLAVAACGGESADPPPPEAAPPEGVYGTAPSAVAGTPSIITLTPTGSAAATLPAREQPVMDQLGLAFSPGLLLVRVGEAARFTNSETIAHNVRLSFSDNDSTVLDAETDPTDHVDFLFELEGGYEVTCDHHPGMRAFVYATSASYATFADHAGGFVIEDVPVGSYTFAIWSVDSAQRSERTVDVTGPSTEVSLGPS